MGSPPSKYTIEQPATAAWPMTSCIWPASSSLPAAGCPRRSSGRRRRCSGRSRAGGEPRGAAAAAPVGVAVAPPRGRAVRARRVTGRSWRNCTPRCAPRRVAGTEHARQDTGRRRRGMGHKGRRLAVESWDAGHACVQRPMRKAGAFMPIGRPNVERLDARGMIEGLLRASKYKKDPEVAEQARLALERRMPLLLDTFQSKNTRHMVLPATPSIRSVSRRCRSSPTSSTTAIPGGARTRSTYSARSACRPCCRRLPTRFRDRDSGRAPDRRALALEDRRLAGRRALRSSLRDRDEGCAHGRHEGAQKARLGGS